MKPFPVNGMNPLENKISKVYDREINCLNELYWGCVLKHHSSHSFYKLISLLGAMKSIKWFLRNIYAAVGQILSQIIITKPNSSTFQSHQNLEPDISIFSHDRFFHTPFKTLSRGARILIEIDHQRLKVL